MIDIHCHILPGIDDGAKTLQDTRDMLQMAIDEGIKVITASPHYNAEYHNERALILEKVALVEKLIEEENLPIKVLPGQEIRIYGDVIKDYVSGKLLTSADFSRFMLIEFPTQQVPTYASRLFYEMTLEGFQPILVHPERNLEILRNPNLLFDFVNQGVLTQITAASITGHFGKKIQKFSMEIIENQLAHTIASDAHNVTSRSFKMKEAFALISKEFGDDWSDYFVRNAKQIILDGEVKLTPPAKRRKKKFFRRF